MAAGALIGVAFFLWGLARVGQRREEPWPSRRRWQSIFAFTAAAVLSSAAYAGVQFSEIFYRTQILSRVCVSIALASALGAWRGGSELRRRLAAAAAAAFVFCGVWGGLERQDYFLASWRIHRRELASILEVAPGLQRETQVILRSRPTPDRYLATEADYLAESWVKLLYDDPSLQILRLAADRGTGCRAAGSELLCWREGQAECVAQASCPPLRFALERTVVLDYDETTGTYHLLPSLAGDDLAPGLEPRAAERYRPRERFIAQPWTRAQERLLLR